MARIFISYARRDLGIVAPLAASLRQGGYDLWIDYESIDPGSEYAQDIEAALVAVDYVLVVVTKNSKVSNWVQREIECTMAAWQTQGNLRVIPISVNGESLPEELSKFHAIPMDSSADDVSSVLLARLDHTYERELWSLEDRASYAARHGKPFDATQIHPLQCGACGDPNGLMVHWLVETMAAYDRLDYRPTTTLTSSRLLTMLSYIFTEKPTDLAWDNSLELFRQIFMILNSITSEQWESEHGSEKIGIGARVMVTVRLPDSVLFFAAGHVSGMYLVEDESLAAAHPELGPNAMRSQILGPGLEAHLGRSIFHSDIANRAPIGHIDRIEKVVPSRIDNVHADNRCSYFMLNSMLEVEDLGPMMEGVNPRDTLAVTKAMARFGANKVRKRIGRRAEALAVGAMA